MNKKFIFIVIVLSMLLPVIAYSFNLIYSSNSYGEMFSVPV